jgi:integrase
MPRLRNSVPKYRKHKASGQAVVKLNGQDIYLGPHGTKVSRREYDRLVSEWLAGGRQLVITAGDGLTIVEAIARYWRHAKAYYVKNGRPTAEQACIRAALRFVIEFYADTPAAEFSPVSLKAVRNQMVEAGSARSTVNKNVGRIRRLYRWLASEQLIPVAVYQALTVVDGLRKGRTTAREPEPIAPVDDATVEQTMPFLPTVVRDMIRVQRFTGMRPAEVCILRPCDLDRSGDVWQFTPQSHKTEHRGGRRTVCIGPRAQGVLLKYLARAPESFCFSPADSEEKRLAARHAARRVSISCGNRPGSSRRRKPRRAAGERYSAGAFRRSVHRGCDRAFRHPTLSAIPKSKLAAEQLAELKKWQSAHRWSPNRLRHSAATEIRARFGIEAVRTVLGHAEMSTSEIYAERDHTLAARVAREVG